MTTRINKLNLTAIAFSLFAIALASGPNPARAAGVTVPNFSFEDGVLGDSVAVPSWTPDHDVGSHSIRNSAGVGGFQATDGTQLLTFRTGGGVPNGVRSYSSLRQTLSETIDSSQIYNLTVDVGHYDPAFNGGPAGLELYWDNAGTPTRIAATAAIPGSFGNKTYNLQVSGNNLAGIGGQAMGIRLFTTQETTNFHVAYDNVRLDKVAAPTPEGSPTSITVPDFSFETSGTNDHSWTLLNPVVWGGSGWPISGTGYGQAATDGADKGVNTAYQLLSDTFVEGATYVLTVEHSLRGDAGQEFDTGSIMFFREDQHPGDLMHIGGPTIAILDGSLSDGNNPAGLNGAGDWITQTLTYVATAADDGQQVGIMVHTASGYQSVWDDVRLTVDLAQAEAQAVVPEPSTFALGLIGLVGLGLFARRRRTR